jgi:translation initiation factor IF-2
MSKVRVYEVAKQLNMDQKTLVSLFQSMGVNDVRNHMSAVEPDAVERLKRHLERQSTPHVVEERIRPTVVKRRARAAEGGEAGAHVPAARPSAPAAEPSAARAVPPAPGSRVAPPAPASRSAASVPEAEPSAPVRRAPPPPSSAGRAAPVAPPPASRAKAPPPPASAPAVAAAPVPKAAPSADRAAPAPAPEKAEPAPVAEAKAPPAPKSAARAPVAAPPPIEHFEPIAKEAPIVEAKAPTPPPPAPVVVEPPPPPAPPVVVAAPIAAAPPPAPVAPPPTPAPPSPPPVMQAKQVPPPAATPRQPVTPPASATPSTPPRRPSQPPKTGIEVWGGRAGVPMPPVRTGPPARRTTYDPRASAPAPRPGAPTFGPPGRSGGGPQNRNNRPNFRPRPGMGGPLNRKPAMVSTQEMASHKKVIKIEEQVSLQQLAAKMSLKSTDVLMRLLSMGMPGVNINSTLDADTAKILASEFGWAVEDVAVSETDAITAAMGATDDTEAEHEVRPPIVTVMGHVDHGKTSLLDRIRRASVAEGEAGGITQHVGAYRVETPRGTIAFLDTPGHEAFTAMRARGASVTDIVILVVAADDGVMPQTKEAINHAQAAKVPIIVAVNKIDKPGADPEKIKRDLASLGLQPEEWGGETMFVHVSAKTGEGIEQLLETVLLQAEVLELTASPKRRASGTVIEALLDRGRGPVARVMIQDGTLRTGDVLLAGGAWGKVRAMTDELGRPVAEAGPATPVEVLGLNEVPSAGDPVHAVKDAKTAEEIAETRRKKASKTLIPQDSRVSLETLTKNLSEADQLELKLIIKGDVQGSVEAVGHALAKLSTAKVKVTIVHAAVGAITEGDVNLAVASRRSSPASTSAPRASPPRSPRAKAWRSGSTTSSTTPSTTSARRWRACSPPPRWRRSSAAPRFVRSSTSPRSASSPAAW